MTAVDIVVVGGGLAGLTAGLFAARHGHSTLVLVADLPGGHLLNVEQIEDFPGFPNGVPGYELCPLIQEQAANQGAEFQMATAEQLSPQDRDWLVALSDGATIQASAVIVATGARPRLLGLAGEEALTGRGISHCASCDGPLLRGRPAVVVGGGDSALQEALTLAKHASQVTIVHRRDAFTAQVAFQRRALDHPTINVRWSTVVDGLLGDDRLTGVQLRQTSTDMVDELAAAALFVYIGAIPNTGWLGDLVPLDEQGRISTDQWLQTARPGLLAAGDVRRDAAGQAITAAADGAVAALSAHRYLLTR